MQKNKVVGLVGYAGAGKGTVAAHLVAQYGFIELSFAKKLKEIISAVFDVPLHCFEDRSLKNVDHTNIHYSTIDRRFASGAAFVEYFVPVLMELYCKDEAEIRNTRWPEIVAAGFYQLLPDNGCSPRRAAQLIGTELFRDQISPSTWTDYVERQSRMLMLQGKNVIVSDLRFPDELATIRRLAGAPWYVNRADVENHDHVSEQHITAMRCDCDFEVCNFSTIDVLKFNADSVHDACFSQRIAA